MGLKREKAENIINRHVLYSMGAGAIPIPLVDLGAVTAVQLDMIKQICENYDIDFNEVTGKSFIASLTGSLFARYGASLVKAVPGIGSLLGGISMVVMSGASTYAVGQVCTSLLEGNIDLDNFDVDKARQMFDKEFKKGKEVAQDLKDKHEAEKESTPEPAAAPAPPKQEPEDIYALLIKLGELRDKKIITVEEFEAKKTELLAKF
ncbi:MAG: DUF697 domain-containing protein [Bacteroidota bacterium]